MSCVCEPLPQGWGTARPKFKCRGDQWGRSSIYSGFPVLALKYTQSAGMLPQALSSHGSFYLIRQLTELIVRKQQKGMLQRTEPEHLYGAIN